MQVRQLANRFLFEVDDAIANTPGTVKARELVVVTALEYLNRLSAESSFWQVLSVPPLLIGLLGSLGYLGLVIGSGSVDQIESQLLSASATVLTPDVVDSLVRPTLGSMAHLVLPGHGRAPMRSPGPSEWKPGSSSRFPHGRALGDTRGEARGLDAPRNR